MDLRIKQLASRLYIQFAVGGKSYLLQQADGTYRATRRRIHTARIRKMLESGESLAVFQFCSGFTRWICMDFDLHSSALSTDGAESNLEPVLVRTKICSAKLKSLGINHIVEYSGNRGFHVWILLRDKVTRSIAYQMLTGILNECGLSEDLMPVKIDRFPASATSRSDKGRAVKVPLSKHVKSGHYSYIIENIELLEKSESITKVTELTEEFIALQLSLLGNASVTDSKTVFEKLGMAAPTQVALALRPSYLRADLTLEDPKEISLDEVLRALRCCKSINSLLVELDEGTKPDESTRVVLVGLLARIRSINNPNLGIELLHELFARFPGYDDVRTLEKISGLLKLRPPTCNFIHDLFPQYSCECKSVDGQPTSPVQHLEQLGFKLLIANPFVLNEHEAVSVRNAELNYIRENDEVSLVWTERELAGMSMAAVTEICSLQKPMDTSLEQFYKFNRQEDGGERTLYAQSSKDRIRTSAGAYVLNDLLHQGISSNSYGYKISPQFYGGKIFYHWLQQWREYTSSIAQIIFSPDYEDWTVLKLDIKSFYGSIDLERLRIKLYDGPSLAFRHLYRELPEFDRESYRRIADELIDHSRKITGESVGLPQGPAFARFLAEVFLMDFDSIVEAHPSVLPGHYARYVDDIFIFVHPESDVDSLEAEVLQSLALIGLKNNPKKYHKGKISEFRKGFKEYWQDTKYFVDQVSKTYSSAPVEAVRKAARDLFSIIDSEGVDEIRRENLNFLALQQNLWVNFGSGSFPSV